MIIVIISTIKQNDNHSVLIAPFSRYLLKYKDMNPVRTLQHNFSHLILIQIKLMTITNDKLSKEF